MANDKKSNKTTTNDYILRVPKMQFMCKHVRNKLRQLALLPVHTRCIRTEIFCHFVNLMMNVIAS